MFSVTEAYKQAVADSRRTSTMRATITTKSGKIINIKDSDIIKDTVYITNQSTNGSEYEYGCVYAGELGISIKTDADRYSLYDAKVQPFWSLWTGTEWEEIPLGVFYISEPNRVNDKINIKALDGMTLLDVDVESDTQGTMPQIMQYIADKCDIELAQTAEELMTFTNADIQLSIRADKVETYRDAVAYLGMLTASFAVFDRYGKLKLVRYATESSVTLGKKQRFTGATFSDYTTSFIGVKARFIAEENYAPYEETIGGTGLILDMGDIPIVQGLPETKHLILQNVLAVLKKVKYTPFEMETLGNPALDLGDIITNVSVGRNNAQYISPITYFYWSYRGKNKLRCVGGNPKLAGINNKTNKQINTLSGEIEAKTVVIKSFENAAELEFGDTYTEIASINFAATEGSNPIFLLTVRLELTLDGVVCLQFCTDGVADESRLYKKYLERGVHFVTLAEIYPAEANKRYTISVQAKTEYFESDRRRQQASITTYNNYLAAIAATPPTVVDNVVQFPAYEAGIIDTAVPMCKIAAGGSKAILYGQGIGTEGKWDGTITLRDTLGNVAFAGKLNFATDNITEDISNGMQIPKGATFSAVLGNVAFTGGLTFGKVKAVANVGEIIKAYKFDITSADKYTYDEYITTNNDMFTLKSIYVSESTEETIDSGKLSSVSIDCAGIAVESVVVEEWKD